MDFLILPSLAITLTILPLGFKEPEDEGRPYEHIEIDGLGCLDFDQLGDSLNENAKFMAFFILAELVRLDMVIHQCGELDDLPEELTGLMGDYRREITGMLSYLSEFYHDDPPSYDKSATKKEAARKFKRMLNLHEQFTELAKRNLTFEPGNYDRIMTSLGKIPRLMLQDKDCMSEVRRVAESQDFDFQAYIGPLIDAEEAEED